MNKSFALPLAVVAALGLAACTEVDQDAAADEATDAAAEVEAAADAAAADMEAAADDAMAEMDEMAGDAEAAVEGATTEEAAPAE